MNDRLVYGIGINDAPFPVKPRVNGKQVCHPAYQCWKDMLARCYVDRCKRLNPAYKECSASAEWHTFMGFFSWWEDQPKTGKMQLDKDLLCPGNKVYGPEFCLLVPQIVNAFLSDGGASTAGRKVATKREKRSGKFIARCNNPFTGKTERVGAFRSADEAHEEWRKKKHFHACRLADQVSGARVAKALRSRYNDATN